MDNDLVLVVGSMLSLDDVELFERVRDSRVALISVLEDLPLMGSVEFFCRYEAGSEEGVVALLSRELLEGIELPLEVKRYFDEMDEGYISAETNIGEEELCELHDMVKKASKPLIVFGRDMFLNSRVENISKFINLLKKYSGVEISCLGELRADGVDVENIQELESFDGTVVFRYCCEKDRELLIGSSQFSVASKLKDGDSITLNNQNREFKIDTKLKGTIALMPTQAEENSYRFKVAKITKREVV